MCKETILKLLETLKPLKDELDQTIDKITNLNSEFDSIDFEPELEKEEVEEAIENLENVIDTILSEEGKASMRKEIEAYQKKLNELEEIEEKADEIKDIFADIKEKAEELEF